MKKIPLVLFIGLVSVFLVYGLAYAITGNCVNCHTMHNSQDGEYMAKTYSAGSVSTSDTPQGQLLRASCIACHAGNTGSATNEFGAPIVLRINGAPDGQGGTYTLAGGDFYWVADDLGADDTKGHNVTGINVEDDNIHYAPPGYDSGAAPDALGESVAGASAWGSNLLTCAGKYGCHGNHTDTDNMAGISGAHHTNTGLTSTQAENPTTLGDSYRFLGGINGLEHSQWNWAESSSVHNEYYGADVNPSTYGNKRTINYLCAECHGIFHSQIGTSSPWLRHPTDIMLPATGEYGSYNPDGGGVYSVEAPVARPTVPTSSSNSVTEGTDAIVMCLSCHRAHGSPEADLLRWTYSGMQAGSGTSDTGCFTCHTQKNAD